jgi:hypothetical protein
VDASIKAAVNRLVVSDYGSNHQSAELLKVFPIAASKRKTNEELKAKETPGWSWTSIFTGLLFD